MERDFLDEMIEESAERNPEFPALMEEARQRRLHTDENLDAMPYNSVWSAPSGKAVGADNED